MRQRPDVTRLKRLLVYALAGNGDLAEAAKTAQGFIAAGDTDPEIAAELAQIDAKLHPPPPSPATLAYEAARRATRLMLPAIMPARSPPRAARSAISRTMRNTKRF